MGILRNIITRAPHATLEPLESLNRTATHIGQVNDVSDLDAVDVKTCLADIDRPPLQLFRDLRRVEPP